MTEKLIDVLKKMFITHRVIFWYDADEKMRDVYDNVDLPDVQKIILCNNEFGIKVQILHGDHKAKYLLYSPNPKPAHKDNWLLDILLANAEFSSSMPTIYLNEMRWPRERLSFIESHEQFFNSIERRNKLNSLIDDSSNPGCGADIEQKMISVLCNVDNVFENVLYKLFTMQSNNDDRLFDQIERFHLSGYLWSTIFARFGYREDEPNIRSLIYYIFESATAKSIGSNFASAGANQSYIFAEMWQNNKKFEMDYEYWAEEVANNLQLESSFVAAHTPSELVNCDTYDFIDKIIIKDILGQIANNDYDQCNINETITVRRTLHYFNKFEPYYESINYGLDLIERIDKLSIHIPNPKAGFDEYQNTFALIDFSYRKFIYFSKLGHQTGMLADLVGLVEKKYTNDYLIELSNCWQKQVDNMDRWEIDGINSQNMFYDFIVEPVTSKNKRLLVIISDGLRYESAIELQDRLIAEDRYTANITACLGSLPSYTQLGMAAMLPHNKITFDDNTDTVFIDGQSSKGTNNRTKILQKRNKRGIAISYEDFINLGGDKGREFIKDYDAIYVYKNKIDKTGDEKSTEHEICKATEEELSDLVELVKYSSNLNINNMIVTSDHGYIFQNSSLDSTDFTVNEAIGDKYKVNRRFIIGKNLTQADNMRKFNAEQAGFSDDTEILIPKGVGRIRIKGAGSRYVHGGASLQEVVIPILEINKARKTDINYVNIVALFSRNEISSNITGVEFYQQEPVEGKVQPRTILAAFYDKDNNKISDEKTIDANMTDQDNSKRTIRHSFSFGADSSKLSGQTVYLKLNQQIQGTNRYTVYRQYEFSMKIAFSNDFDSF